MLYILLWLFWGTIEFEDWAVKLLQTSDTLWHPLTWALGPVACRVCLALLGVVEFLHKSYMWGAKPVWIIASHLLGTLPSVSIYVVAYCSLLGGCVASILWVLSLSFEKFFFSGKCLLNAKWLWLYTVFRCSFHFSITYFPKTWKNVSI